MAIAFDDPPALDSISAGRSRSLASYWQPRYWPAWMLIGWMRISTLLPWRFAIRLHKGIGRLAWRLMSRHRVVVERNISLCFPHLDDDAVGELVLQHFENLGACLAETALAWFGRVDQSRIEFRIEGDEHVYAALAEGRGAILYTGHFTSLEIFAPVLKETFPRFGAMFHSRRNELIDEIQQRARQRVADILIPSNGVRAMLRALRGNAVVWYAPDQCFASQSSTVLPFFGEPATVSTTTSRIARVSGAAVIPFAYYRLADDSGYVLRFEPALEAVGTRDERACTRRLITVLERFIEECPSQYAWTHQRLKHRPTAGRSHLFQKATQ